MKSTFTSAWTPPLTPAQILLLLQWSPSTKTPLISNSPSIKTTAFCPNLSKYIVSSPWWETTPLQRPYFLGVRCGLCRGGPLYYYYYYLKLTASTRGIIFWANFNSSSTLEEKNVHGPHSLLLSSSPSSNIIASNWPSHSGASFERILRENQLRTFTHWGSLAASSVQQPRLLAFTAHYKESAWW